MKKCKKQVANCCPKSKSVCPSRYYKIHLYRYQKEFLSKILPEAISLQIKQRADYQYELNELKRCKELKNVNAENEKLKKQLIWMTKMSQFSDVQVLNQQVQRSEVQVPVTKKNLIVELLSKLTKIIEINQPQNSTFRSSCQILLSQAKQWKGKKYQQRLKFLNNRIKQLHNSMPFDGNDETIDCLKKEIQKTQDLLSLFRSKQSKIYMLSEVSNQVLTSEFSEIDEKDFEKRKEKREKLTEKIYNKSHRRITKQISEEETALSFSIDVLPSETKIQNSISSDETEKIADELKKLNNFDQEKLISDLTNTKINGLISSLKREEAISFMAKIKQTIRRKGKRENNVSDGGEKKSILFFEENSETE